ncbi:hypothetical protein BC830DRAFT_1154417 [Chytriomyces sp. MP71]|nr:hypothetical protein BC830DRAFT_1154417 [Chytriomyces sp. MP71]
MPETRATRKRPATSLESSANDAPNSSSKAHSCSQERVDVPLLRADDAEATKKDSVAKMTEEEMALYDRQIRLWGLEAQTRMRTARILVIGVCGLAAEVCKNIVLAGIGSVTVLDSEPVSFRDIGANFFLTADDIGVNRADAAVVRIRNLNPRVDVKSLKNDITSLDALFLANYDLVLVASKVSLKELTRVNNLCRASGIKFMSGAVYGTHGYMFSDLLKYEYIEERNHTENGVVSVKRTKKTQDFCSLESARQTRFDSVRPKLLKRFSPVFFALQIIWRYEMEFGQMPNMLEINDSKKLESMISEYLSSTGGDLTTLMSLLPSSFVLAVANETSLELSPVCAIVGGIVSQEILNVVSAKEVDVCNFFCFGQSIGGVVESLGFKPQ